MKALLLAAVLILVAAVPTPGLAHEGSARPDSVVGTLQIGPFVAHPYDGFWSVVLNGGHLLNSTLAAEFNATPFVLVRYGAEIDATNVSNDCTYTDSGICQPADMNYPEFATFCGWVHCRAVLGVPAETDDPGLAAMTVRYIEDTVGFHPAFWSIGNEPEGWNHWNIPFPLWRGADSSTPTAPQFALETVAMIQAIRSVDSGAHIIGDQDSQGGGAHSFMSNITKDDRANVDALAFHSYPGHYGPASPTDAQFLSQGNVTRTAIDYEGDVAAAQAGCGCTVPIMVGEFNGGFGGSLAPYMRGYPDAPMTAAVAAQLLTDNAAIFSFFSFTGAMPFDLVNSSTNAGNPTYAMYAGLLAYLPMGSTYAVSINTTLRGAYAVEEINNTSQAGVLVVNTNTTSPLDLSLGSLMTSVGGAVISDTKTSGVATATFDAGMGPSNATVAPEEIALFLPGETAGTTAAKGGAPTGGGGDQGSGGIGGSKSPGPSGGHGSPFPLAALLVGTAAAIGAVTVVSVLFVIPRRRKGR